MISILFACTVTPEDEDEEEPAVFYAKREYQSQLEDELSFPTGAKITVINKSISGWWTARSVGWLVGQSVSRLVGWLVGGSVGRLVGHLVICLDGGRIHMFLVFFDA